MARKEFDLLPENDESDQLTKEEFDKVVVRMKNNKATGADGIPAEVWKHSAVANEMLLLFLQLIWRKEYIPPELIVCVFVLIYKKKGLPDDCSMYRAIGLLNHAYKILSVILLGRLTEECKHFFSDWQAGFRPGRGCRDNILLLRVLYDHIISGNKNCVVTFIDYAATFDSVSHKYIDEALKRAGASRKTRAIFRQIYAAAAGAARVYGTDDEHVFSQRFDIARGVIQGDIISPVLFILALDQLVQQHDHHGTGQKCSEILTMRILGYADDAALIEPQISDMTNRLTTLANHSRADADMQVKMAKTFSQHVFAREKITVSAAELEAVETKYKHTCQYCDRRFKTARAQHIHEATCMHSYDTTDKKFVVEEIADVFGHITCRWYLVKWEGYPTPEWERGHLFREDGCEDMIKDFWLRSGLSPCKEIHAEPHGHHRCYVCAKKFKHSQDLKSHITRTGHRIDKTYAASKTTVTEAALHKREVQQQQLPKSYWNDIPADNCWRFCYLGALFQTDGWQLTDIDRRIAMTAQRRGGAPPNDRVHEI